MAASHDLTNNPMIYSIILAKDRHIRNLSRSTSKSKNYVVIRGFVEHFPQSSLDVYDLLQPDLRQSC